MDISLNIPCTTLQALARYLFITILFFSFSFVRRVCHWHEAKICLRNRRKAEGPHAVAILARFSLPKTHFQEQHHKRHQRSCQDIFVLSLFKDALFSNHGYSSICSNMSQQTNNCIKLEMTSSCRHAINTE